MKKKSLFIIVIIAILVLNTSIFAQYNYEFGYQARNAFTATIECETDTTDLAVLSLFHSVYSEAMRELCDSTNVYGIDYAASDSMKEWYKALSARIQDGRITIIPTEGSESFAVIWIYKNRVRIDIHHSFTW